jgi:hypothetical protein
MICPDCIVANDVIARYGFTPVPFREATEPVTTYDGRHFEPVTTYDGRHFLVCWAHEVLYRWGRPPIVPIG